MRILEANVSYALRTVVLLAASFFAIMIGLIWLGVDLRPWHIENILPAVDLGSALLAFLLWVIECFMKPNPARPWARLIDTFLALGWFVAIWAFTARSVGSAVP